MITCTRTIEFDYGHRVFKHESKCRHIHGHRGVVEVTAKLDTELDSLGRVIDFSVLKEKIGGWIDSNWDHNFLVSQYDVETRKALLAISDSRPPYICSFNPTAENMAEYLLKVVCPEVLKGTGVTITKVIFHETPNGKAEACL